jgi:D-sedoheptulose 7-phosphate isomerase
VLVPDRRGGGAANCSHAVRKLCGIEVYSPVDNVSELTARTNNAGWDTVFAAWLDTGHLGDKEAILIYSAGGGDAKRKISANIVQAIDLAKARSAKVFGIVARDSGYTAKHSDVVVLIPRSTSWVTPL